VAASRHVRPSWNAASRRARSCVPILFQQYTVDPLSVIEWRGLTLYLYADNLAHRVTPTDSERVANCIADVDDWRGSNRLQLNIDKTGLLWCSSSRHQHQLPSVPLSFDGNEVTASSVVRKRGVFVDLDLSLRHHVVVIVARFRQLLKHPLSRRCSDDIADDVAYLCAVRLLQQHPVRPPGCHRFSPAVLPESCCSCGLRSSSDCPRHRHPDMPSLASCRCLSASASKSRC
jgi:hypothetical protein